MTLLHAQRVAKGEGHCRCAGWIALCRAGRAATILAHVSPGRDFAVSLAALSVFLTVVLIGSYVQAVAGFAMAMLIIAVVTVGGLFDIVTITAVVSLVSFANIALSLHGHYHLVHGGVLRALCAVYRPTACVAGRVLASGADEWCGPELARALARRVHRGRKPVDDVASSAAGDGIGEFPMPACRLPRFGPRCSDSSQLPRCSEPLWSGCTVASQTMYCCLRPSGYPRCSSEPGSGGVGRRRWVKAACGAWHSACCL